MPGYYYNDTLYLLVSGQHVFDTSDHIYFPVLPTGIEAYVYVEKNYAGKLIVLVIKDKPTQTPKKKYI